jgi:hypothetical protein
MLTFYRMLLTTLLLALASCSAGGFRLESGTAMFEADDDNAIDSAPELGLGYLSRTTGTGWVGDAALRYSALEGDGFDGYRAALDLGTRLYPRSGSSIYRPFIGFGGTLQRFDLSDAAGDGETTVPGVYGVVGAEFVVGRHVLLGVQYRHTAGLDDNLGDTEEQNLDHGTFSLTLGFGL